MKVFLLQKTYDKLQSEFEQGKISTIDYLYLCDYFEYKRNLYTVELN